MDNEFLSHNVNLLKTLKYLELLNMRILALALVLMAIVLNLNVNFNVGLVMSEKVEVMKISSHKKTFSKTSESPKELVTTVKLSLDLAETLLMLSTNINLSYGNNKTDELNKELSQNIEKILEKIDMKLSVVSDRIINDLKKSLVCMRIDTEKASLPPGNITFDELLRLLKYLTMERDDRYQEILKLLKSKSKTIDDLEKLIAKQTGDDDWNWFDW
uniref:Uncharacterized protein n=1 Tax=Glossina brevipalpis TaxID=37001 RepID=A0A1A9WU27_9MUSC